MFAYGGQNIMQVVAVLLLCGTAACLNWSWGRRQRVKASGRLTCGHLPAANIVVRLVDEDDGPDPNDLMAETRTGPNGSFELDGTESEITPIDPVIEVYTNCNKPKKLKSCDRKWRIKIPDKYIMKEGEMQEKVFKLGTINLHALLRGESRDCFH